MRVLVVEDQPGAAASAEARLRESGHRTVSCTDPDTGAPCRALVAQPCPLDGEGVDAMVVALGSSDGPVPPGFICAARRHVPALSLAGVGEDADVGRAVEDLATLTPPGHAEAAREAARASLERHGLADIDVWAAVRRERGRLRVDLVTDRSVDPAVAQAMSVRAFAAVRLLDRSAPAISVSVGAASAGPPGTDGGQ